MYQTYPQQQQPQGYMPQQPSPPIMGAGATPGAPQQPYGGQQTQFQPAQYQPYPQQQQQQAQQQNQQFQPQQFQPGQPQQFQPQQQQGPPQAPHPDRESYQTALPPTVTPGWNDPPPILSHSSGAPNRLSNMRRRPVDPSITGTGGYGAAPQTANPYGGAAYGGAQQQDPQQQYQQQQQQYQAYQQQQNPQQYGQQQYPGAPQQQQHYGM